jgi:putative ABC transport system substrate-binding protein
MRDMEEAALTIERRLAIVTASTETETDAALATLTRLHAGALVVASDPFFNFRRDQLVGLAARHAIPAIYEWREIAGPAA